MRTFAESKWSLSSRAIQFCLTSSLFQLSSAHPGSTLDSTAHPSLVPPRPRRVQPISLLLLHPSPALFVPPRLIRPARLVRLRPVEPRLPTRSYRSRTRFPQLCGPLAQSPTNDAFAQTPTRTPPPPARAHRRRQRGRGLLPQGYGRDLPRLRVRPSPPRPLPVELANSLPRLSLPPPSSRPSVLAFPSRSATPTGPTLPGSPTSTPRSSNASSRANPTWTTLLRSRVSASRRGSCAKGSPTSSRARYSARCSFVSTLPAQSLALGVSEGCTVQLKGTAGAGLGRSMTGYGLSAAADAGLVCRGHGTIGRARRPCVRTIQGAILHWREGLCRPRRRQVRSSSPSPLSALS
jgi:hypothetical protein